MKCRFMCENKQYIVILYVQKYNNIAKQIYLEHDQLWFNVCNSMR